MGVQNLMESEMGMQLSEMRQLAQADNLAQGGRRLTGAHMPARGFYLLTNPQVATVV